MNLIDPSLRDPSAVIESVHRIDGGNQTVFGIQLSLVRRRGSLKLETSSDLARRRTLAERSVASSTSSSRVDFTVEGLKDVPQGFYRARLDQP